LEQKGLPRQQFAAISKAHFAMADAAPDCAAPHPRYQAANN
jgi:hypothetical protein